METQQKLWQYDRKLFGNSVVKLEPNKHSLEDEKGNFIRALCIFIDNLNLETLQFMGRPRANIKDILKSLLIISYHSFSYRRIKYDLEQMHKDGIITCLMPRSTLNDYSNKKEAIKLLEKLIMASSVFFSANENTIIVDSTWFGIRMYSGGYRKVYDKKSTSLEKCRKLHISIAKNSRIITCAKATFGTVHDSPIFRKLVRRTVRNGFNITDVIADAGYSSKKNYALCKELGIRNVFIDFRSNARTKRGKSDIWREQLKLFKEHHDIWHESYRFRVLIEAVWSAIKRKNLNWLRSKNETARYVELLLKVLVYNLTIIGKYS